MQAVTRALSLSERAIALACAVTIDFDYFSQHSGRPGLMSALPFFPMPMPMPVPVPSGAGEGAGDVLGGSPGTGNTVDGDSSIDLGSDEFAPDDESGDGWTLGSLWDAITEE